MNTTDTLDVIAPTLVEHRYFDASQTLYQIMISADSARRDGFVATADALMDVARHLSVTVPPSAAMTLPRLADRVPTGDTT